MEMPIPDDWNGEDFCRYAVCWPDSVKWRAILSGLVEMPNQGRFWDFSTGNFITLREQFRTAYDYNFDLEEAIVACSDMSILAQAIENLGLRIAGGNCGCDQQVTVIIEDGIVFPGSEPFEPPIDPGGEEPPEGFDTMADYLEYKCRVANAIVDGLQQTLTNLSVLTIAQLALGAGALGVLIAAGIIITGPVLVIFVTLLGLLGASMGVLGDLAGYVEDNRDDIICALYNSGSGAAAMNAWGDIVDEAIEFLALTPGVGAAVRAVAVYLLTTDTVNQMFKAYLDFAYPDADCSGCLSGCAGCYNVFQWDDTSGSTYTNRGTPEVTLGAEYNASGDYWFVFAYFENPQQFVVTDLTGWTTTSNAVDFQIGSVAAPGNLGTDVYFSDDIPVGATGCAGNFAFHSATDFTVTIDCI